MWNKNRTGTGNLLWQNVWHSTYNKVTFKILLLLSRFIKSYVNLHVIGSGGKDHKHRTVYQDMINEIRATLQLVSDGTGCLLQQMQPATVFIVDCASIRQTADINPSAKAGLLGYMHSPGVVV
jgi:hypothetical protein